MLLYLQTVQFLLQRVQISSVSLFHLQAEKSDGGAPPAGENRPPAAHQLFSGPLHLAAPLDGLVKPLMAEELLLDGRGLLAPGRRFDQALQWQRTRVERRSLTRVASRGQYTRGQSWEDRSRKSDGDSSEGSEEKVRGQKLGGTIIRPLSSPSAGKMMVGPTLLFTSISTNSGAAPKSLSAAGELHTSTALCAVGAGHTHSKCGIKEPVGDQLLQLLDDGSFIQQLQVWWNLQLRGHQIRPDEPPKSQVRLLFS